MTEEKKETGQQIGESGKKVYATPTFIKYGSVSKLTRGGSSPVGSDAVHMGMMH